MPRATHGGDSNVERDAGMRAPAVPKAKAARAADPRASVVERIANTVSQMLAVQERASCLVAQGWSCEARYPGFSVWSLNGQWRYVLPEGCKEWPCF